MWQTSTRFPIYNSTHNPPPSVQSQLPWQAHDRNIVAAKALALTEVKKCLVRVIRLVLKSCISNTPVQSGCGFYEFDRLHESRPTLGRGQERPCVELRPRCVRISMFATGGFRCPQLTSFSRKKLLRNIPRRLRDADEAYGGQI